MSEEQTLPTYLEYIRQPIPKHQALMSCSSAAMLLGGRPHILIEAVNRGIIPSYTDIIPGKRLVCPQEVVQTITKVYQDYNLLKQMKY